MRTLLPGVVLACVLSVVGCRSEQPRPGTMTMGDDATASHNGPLSAVQLQGSLMAFADRFLSRIEEATDRIEAATTDPRVRMLAHATKYYPSLAVVTTAADSDPEVALLDMLTLVTLERSVWEAGRANEEFGPMAADLIAAQRELEADAWAIAAKVLTEEEMKALRALLEGWLAEHPNQRYVSMVRFDDFSHLRDVRLRERSTVIKVNLVLADTSQAAAEVRRTRLFAERALFLAGRMPLLTAWQVELLAYDLAMAPEVRQSLDTTTSLSDSIRRIADDVHALPGNIEAQTQKTIELLDEREQRLSELVGEIREGLTEADAVVQRAERVSADLKQVAAETANAANALNTMVMSADQLVARFDSGSGSGGPTTQPGARPFDIREYTQSLSELTIAAQELNTFVERSDQMLASSAWQSRVGEIDAAAARRIDQVDAVSQRWLADLDARAQQLADRVTTRGIWLIAIGFAAALVAAGIIRMLPRARA